MRDWVCVRPLSYENKAEADWLRPIFNRNGALENTVFTLVDVAANKQLVPAGRGPYWAWPGCDESPQLMADGLVSLLKKFKPTAEASTVPLVGSVRNALNVAACDNQPLAVVVGTPEQRTALLAELQAPVWAEDTRGRMVFVEASSSEDLKPIGGEIPSQGVVFVQPGEYGVDGTVLCTGVLGDLKSSFTKALAAFKPIDKSNHRAHLSNAVRKGIRWRPVIPVEDRASQQATKGLWGGN